MWNTALVRRTHSRFPPVVCAARYSEGMVGSERTGAAIALEARDSTSSSADTFDLSDIVPVSRIVTT